LDSGACAVPSWIDNHRALAFEGTLGQGKQAEPVQVVITDWDFVDSPIVLLRQDSELLRNPTNPHIGIYGHICYRTDGIGILNAHVPQNAVAACLRDAEEVVAQIKTGGKWTDAEIQREFEAYWKGVPLISCGLDFSKKEAKVFLPEGDSPPYGWIYQDVERARAIARSMGVEPHPGGKVHLLKARRSLSVGGAGGIPSNTKSLLNWLRCWDPVIHRDVIELISKKEFFQDASPRIIIQADNATIGFRILLDENSLKAFEDKAREFPHRLRHPYLPPIKIRRYGVANASPEFIYSRNGQQSLGGKKILLIGAGAIGGYLADNLVRMGAGHAGGRLTIIDPDTLLPGNLSRHRLGMDSVLNFKADALAKRLDTEFPWLNIKPIHEDVLTYRGIFQADLVIDATGDEALGRAINRRHQALPADSSPPVLYCWVAGAGDGVQAIWVDAERGHACLECLAHHDNQGNWTPRFKFLRGTTKLMFVGCAAVTPYAVSSAMTAAALASEMIGDWLTGNVNPRFRSRARSHGETHSIRDSSPDRLKECPACRRT
jgi:molybdopterin/thiamine biosynthesis adenylyltransferase